MSQENNAPGEAAGDPGPKGGLRPFNRTPTRKPPARRAAAGRTPARKPPAAKPPAQDAPAQDPPAQEENAGSPQFVRWAPPTEPSFGEPAPPATSPAGPGPGGAGPGGAAPAGPGAGGPVPDGPAVGDESGPLPLGPPTTVKWAPPSDLPTFGARHDDDDGEGDGREDGDDSQADEPEPARQEPSDSTAPTPLFRDSLFSDPLFADLSPGDAEPGGLMSGLAGGDEPAAPPAWQTDPASYLAPGRGIYDPPPSGGDPESGGYLSEPSEPGGYLANEPDAGEYAADEPRSGADDYHYLTDEPEPDDGPLAGADPISADPIGAEPASGRLTGSPPPEPDWPDPEPDWPDPEPDWPDPEPGPAPAGSVSGQRPATSPPPEPDWPDPEPDWPGPEPEPARGAAGFGPDDDAAGDSGGFRSWFEPPPGDEPAEPEPSIPEPSGTEQSWPEPSGAEPPGSAPFDPAAFDREPFSPSPSLRPFGSGLPSAGTPVAGPAEAEPFGTPPFGSGAPGQGTGGSRPAEPDWDEAAAAGAAAAVSPGAGPTDAAATSPLPASHELEDPDFAEPPPRGSAPDAGPAAPGEAPPSQPAPAVAPPRVAPPGAATPGAPGAAAPGQGRPAHLVLEDPDFADPPLADSVPDETPDEDSEEDEEDNVFNSPPVLGAVPPGTVMAGAAERLAGLRAIQFDWAVGVIALASFAVYTTLSVFRYLQLSVGSWDLGIYTEYVRQLSQLHAPVVPIRSAGFNLLGDHFQPIVALIAPFFRLFPSPVTLLVAQALLAALSVVPVCRAAREFLGTTASRVIGVAYGFSWGLQQMIIFDFHEVAFAVPLIACSLSALLRGKPRAALLWALPLVFVKEDQGLTAAAIGLVMLTAAARRAGEGRLAGRPRAWRLSGIILAVWGIAWSVLAITVIIPHFNVAHHYQYWSDGGVFGPSGHFSIGGLLGQFAHAGGQKLRTLVLLLLPVAFLALRSPLALIALPALLLRFMSTNSAFWGTNWHYNATIMPIVFLAAVDALVGFATVNARSGPAPRAGRGHRASRGQRLASPSPVVVRYGAGAMLVIAVVLAFWFPVRGLWSPHTYQVSQHVRAADQAAAKVPSGTTVEATLSLLAPLAARDDTSWVGNTGISAPRYIVYDGSDSGWSPPPAHPLRFLEKRHPGTHYQQIFTDNNVYVFRLQVPAGG